MGKRAEIAQARYNAKRRLLQLQPCCPICGKSVAEATDLHHVIIRRQPDMPELYHLANVSLLHNYCHVPEPPDLGYRCMRQKFQLGIVTLEEVQAWLESLPLRAKRGLPRFVWEAADADNT